MLFKRYLERPLKLRTIVLLLATIAFLSAATGGFLYIRSLHVAALEDAYKRVLTKAVHIERDITAYMADSQKAVKIMAGITALPDALLDPTAKTLESANAILDRFQSILDASVCYLMDHNGNVTASSNRNQSDSFIGINYAFRPYFKEALEGRPSVHLALGVTSNKRGIYYSYPVYNKSGHSEDRIIGVAVIKKEVGDMDKILQRYNEGLTFLVSPLGVIFSSSDISYLFQIFGKNNAKNTQLIHQSQQFGEGPWLAAPFNRHKGAPWIKDASGTRYLIQDRMIEFYPGWRIIYIESADFHTGSVLDPLLHFVGGVVLFFVLFICAGVFFLYRLAANDITQRKIYEDALRESELKFRSLVEHTHEGIVIVNKSYLITYANEEMGRLLGTERNDIVGKDFRDFLDETSRVMVADHYRRRQKGEPVPQRYECVLLRRNGEKKRVEISATVMTDATEQPLTVGLILDVTERVEALEAITESEIKYRSILESIQEGYFEVDLAGNLTFFNDALRAIMNRPLSTLSGINYRDYMKPHQAKAVFQIYNEVFRTGRPAQLTNFEIITGDDQAVNVEGSCSLIRDKDGAAVGFRGVIRDVTAQFDAQKALKESEERYRTVLEGSPDPMVVYDMNGRLLFVNPAFTKIFGWILDECAAHRMDHFVPEEEWPITNFMINKVRAGENFYDVETYRLTKTGEKIPVSISGSTYRDQDQNLLGSIINIRDIRQKRSLESQLRQAQKMEALGTLASGVAHDFNNLLQAIYGYVQLLARRHANDPDSMKYLGEVDSTIQRASELISRMLTFSRKMKPELKAVDLSALILRTVEILKRTIPKMIEIETSITEPLYATYGDSNQLEQMLINLGINAKDAMPNGGRLVIKAENIYLNEESAQNMIELNEGPFIRLTVSDNGIGMDEKTLEHIFEPFFTTKALGQGTGLGLYSIYGIVQAHGGYVTCESQAGEGTQFEIFLPALTESEKIIQIKPSREEDIHGGSETIMLVDDEDSIREIARDLLEFNGYRTIQAKDGEQALISYRENRDQIDLVVLDLGMPGMGGQGCLNELLKINPNLIIIIASGYSDENLIKTALSSGARDYIRKPYRLQDLLKKIRQALDKNR